MYCSLFCLFYLHSHKSLQLKRILWEIKPTASQADSLGENLHTKRSLRPSVALRAHWLLHSRQNRCFLVRHPCDQAGLRKALTTGYERPPWKLNHNGECDQSILMLYSVNHTCVHTSNDRQAGPAPFPKFGVNVKISIQLQEITYCGCTRAIHCSLAH